MKLNRVQSSNVYAIGYNDEEEILYVQFQSGDVYKYFDVPKSVYLRFDEIS